MDDAIAALVTAVACTRDVVVHVGSVAFLAAALCVTSFCAVAEEAVVTKAIDGCVDDGVAAFIAAVIGA